MIAAIEQFLRDTAPPPAPRPRHGRARGSAPRGWRASSALRRASRGWGNRPTRRPHLPAGRFPPLRRPLQRPQDARATLLAPTRALAEELAVDFARRQVPDRTRASSRRPRAAAGSPARTTVTLALAGPATRCGSAPVTCESAARTTPPWQTTSHVPAGGDQLVDGAADARLQVAPTTRRRARAAGRRARPSRCRPGSPRSGRPSHSPTSISRKRGSRRASGIAEQRRGLARAPQVARDDAVVVEARQRGPQQLGLGASGVRERWVGLALEAGLGVVGRLSVADEDQAGG